MFSMILAMDENKLIGNSKTKNGLPWHYKEDLEFYKQKTINKKNVMGSKTHEQIGRALPNRTTYVMSKDKTKKYEGVKVINSLDEILNMEKENPDEEIMIIGGTKIFELFMPYINKIYLTKINKKYEGDAYYNSFTTEGYEKVEEIAGENEDLTFQTWVRK